MCVANYWNKTAVFNTHLKIKGVVQRCNAKINGMPGFRVISRGLARRLKQAVKLKNAPVQRTQRVLNS
jgi:hypothetical protein